VSLGREEFGLKSEEYIVSSFWDSTSWRVRKNDLLFSGTILPHGTILLAVRELKKIECFYIGSNLHISQGLEIERFQIGEGELNLQFSRGKRLEGYIELSLPSIPRSVIHQGKVVKWVRTSDSSYRFLLEGEDPGLLSITY